MSNNQAITKSVMNKLFKEIEKDVIRVGLGITNILRGDPPEGTPIDTGWASSNWIPSIGAPNLKIAGSKLKRVSKVRIVGYANIKALKKGKYNLTSGVTRAPQEAGIASLLKWKIGKGDIFITNNVPYIVRLNEEPQHSSQSKPHFVERAIMKAISDSKYFTTNQTL